MNREDKIRELALDVAKYVNDSRENADLSFSPFLRAMRLKYGFGSTTIKRILREDYDLQVVDDKLV